MYSTCTVGLLDKVSKSMVFQIPLFPFQIIHEKTLEQVGKVLCRNIKYDCPEPRCPDPILRPNTCCYVCRNKGEMFIEFEMCPENFYFKQMPTSKSQFRLVIRAVSAAPLLVSILIEQHRNDIEIR